MADKPTKYNSLVAWRSIASNVRLLTRQTVDDAATYRVDIAVVDTNEVGQGQKEIGFYLTDYIGVPFRIIDVGISTVDVSDDFRTELCPTSGRNAYIHKSAYKGHSLYLPSMCFTHLHPLALTNNNKYSLSILWSNDPNARRIPFTGVDYPEITDYSADIIDSEGKTFNPREDYEENPKFGIFTTDDGGIHYSKQQLEQYITTTDGLISSIIWSGIGDVITGYIEISK